jgi:hypothetical protein
MALGISPNRTRLRVVAGLIAAAAAVATAGGTVTDSPQQLPQWLNTWAGFEAGTAWVEDLWVYDNELRPVTITQVAGTLPAGVTLDLATNVARVRYTPTGGNDVTAWTGVPITLRATTSEGFADATVDVRVWSAAAGIRNLRSGTTHATLQLACDNAQIGDIIVVPPGAYNGVCTITQGFGPGGWQWLSDLTIASRTPGTPFVLDAQGSGTPDGAAIERRGVAGGQLRIVDADLRNVLTNSGSRNSGLWFNPYNDPSAPLRSNNVRVTVRNCDNGFLLGNQRQFSCVWDRCTVEGAGTGETGFTHSLYMGRIDALWVRGCYHSKHGPNGAGHLLKSRARKTVVLASRLTAEASTGVGPSFVIDTPNGGDVLVAGVICEDPANTDNAFGTVVYGQELASSINVPEVFEVNRLRIYQCDIINRAGVSDPQIDINHAGFASRGAPAPTVDIRGNVYSGPGLTGDADNSAVALGAFVDAAAHDYRLITPIAGAPVSVPYVYVHPANFTARADTQRGASPSGVAAPSWYSSTPTHAWHVFAGSAFSSSGVRSALSALYLAAQPNALTGGWGPEGIFAYSGGALARNGLRFGGNLIAGPHLLLWGGGHAATNDNGIVAFGSFSDESPAWRQWTEPEIPPSRQPTETGQQYGPFVGANKRGAGNRPTSRHTYATLGVDAAYGSRGRMLAAPASAMGIQPSIAEPHTDFADLDSAAGSVSPWSPGPNVPGPDVGGNCVLVVNEAERAAYLRPLSGAYDWRRVCRLDLATDVWATHESNSVSPIGGSAAVGALLASRGVTLYTNGGNQLAYAVTTAAGWQSDVIVCTLTGDAIPTPGAEPSQGVVADPVDGVFWFWTADDQAAMYRITPPAGALTGAWTVLRVAATPGGDTTTHTRRDGIYLTGRMQYVPAPTRGIVICGHHSDPVRFWRL